MYCICIMYIINEGEIGYTITSIICLFFIHQIAVHTGFDKIT